MVAVADESFLYLLQFADKKDLEKEIKQLEIQTKSVITAETNKTIESITAELARYFEGKLNKFLTPLFVNGSPFQEVVWKSLLQIPYGETKSYAEQANSIEKPLACRAVASANGANHLAIIIPCHRIINSNGKLGGYSAGLARKKWLLNPENPTKNW